MYRAWLMLLSLQEELDEDVFSYRRRRIYRF